MFVRAQVEGAGGGGPTHGREILDYHRNARKKEIRDPREEHTFSQSEQTGQY